MNSKTYIKALEIERADGWNEAHRIVQDINTPEAAWIHAYLHRVEGDLENAAYWYRRAGKPECIASLEDEWQQIRDALSQATSAHGRPAAEYPSAGLHSLPWTSAFRTRDAERYEQWQPAPSGAYCAYRGCRQ